MKQVRTIERTFRFQLTNSKEGNWHFTNHCFAGNEQVMVDAKTRDDDDDDDTTDDTLAFEFNGIYTDQ